MRDLNGLNDPLRRATDAEAVHAGDVREVSDRLLAEIGRIRHLELESRKAQIGSPDFLRMSEEVAERAGSIVRLSYQQVALARALFRRPTTINELQTSGDGAS